jgi:hypothetical protein
MRGRALLAFAIAAFLAWMPRVAEACAGCIARGDDDSREAFVATTVVLSLLPFLFVGALIWWIRRRARELALRAEAESAPALSRAASSR